MVVIFNLKDSPFIDLPTEEVFLVNGQNRPVANLPVVDFLSQPREMLTPKLLSTQVSILVFFLFQESLNLIVCQRYGFFSVLAAIIRGSSDKQLVLRIVKALPFIHQPDRGRQRLVTCKQLIGYINTREKIRYLFTCVVTTFLRAGNPCITPQFM